MLLLPPLHVRHLLPLRHGEGDHRARAAGPPHPIGGGRITLVLRHLKRYVDLDPSSLRVVFDLRWLFERKIIEEEEYVSYLQKCCEFAFSVVFRRRCHVEPAAATVHPASPDSLQTAFPRRLRVVASLHSPDGRAVDALPVLPRRERGAGRVGDRRAS